MAQKNQADQGTISPTLFIGMGGVGSRIVDRIAGRVKTLPNWDTQLDPLTSFITIDTNEGDQHLLKNIVQGNKLNIASFDKSKAVENYRRSEEKQALQWLDEGYKPRSGIKPGAGQIRIESRLGFFNYSHVIRKRFQQVVDSMLRENITWRQNFPPKFNVYIFCTLAGGTGSGSFLSASYLIKDVIEKVGWQPRLIGNLLLSTLITDKVGPELHADIHANTYAALKELENLTKLDYSKVKATGRDGDEFIYFRNEERNKISKVYHRPFFLAFIYDRPQHLSLSKASEAIADTVFLQVFTPIAADMAGELDNYEKNLEDLTHLPGKYRNVSLGYAKNYGACGAAALSLPSLDLLEYSILRFSAEAIRTQITFGLDKNQDGQDDERIRALSKLAIDYSDPKFLRMSDGDREKAINESFVASVRELARQDEKEGLEGGFWQQLVESADLGAVTAHDNEGQIVRGESHIEAVNRTLKEAARIAMNKVSIKDRNLNVIHPESVGQYIEYVARLNEDVRKAKTLIDNELSLLSRATEEGEAISELELNPIAERYLVIRLLKLCESEWIPDAKSRLEKAEKSDIGDDRVREELEKSNLETLTKHASKKGIFRRVDEDAFNRVRRSVQESFTSAVSAAKTYLEAKIYVEQVRGLQKYLIKRSHQFLKIATRMDALVNELEASAENYRQGRNFIQQLPILRVEVFKTLEEPKERIWDKVYRALYVDAGRYLYTFDRKALSSTISNELKPAIREDGRIAEKGVDETVDDIRSALYKLGKKRMKAAIFGNSSQLGLNILSGLELEAKLMLSANNPAISIEDVTLDDIEAYRKRKLIALSQLSGVLARVNTAESGSLDDGVIVNRTRLVISDINVDNSSSDGFNRQIKNILSTGEVQVKEKEWHDPHLLIVHDVATPVPLYYFEPVIGDIELSYLKKITEENRSYYLHTDYKWEKTLPNLNPNRSEIAVDWSFRLFVKALLSRVIYFSEDNTWVLDLTSLSQYEELGDSLAAATYRLADMYQREGLKKILDDEIEERIQALAEPEFKNEIETYLGLINERLMDYELKDARGKAAREEVLDGPVWLALKLALEETQKSGRDVKRNSGVKHKANYSAFGKR